MWLENKTKRMPTIQIFALSGILSLHGEIKLKLAKVLILYHQQFRAWIAKKIQHHFFGVKDTFFASLETHFETAPARQIYRIVKITQGVLSPKSRKSSLIPFMIYLQVTFRDLFWLPSENKPEKLI